MVATATLTQQPVTNAPDVRFFPSTFIRQADHGELLAPIPGLLEGRVTLISSGGGVGKTTLCEQIARHLASGHRLGQFDLPEQRMNVWLLLLEDIEALTQDRSHRVAKLGVLDEDQLSGELGDDNVWYGYGDGWTIAGLNNKLAEAKAVDQLPGLVIIDHLRLIIGSQPTGISANDWERGNLRKLVKLAEAFETHIVVLTHINKAGLVSGTTEMINTVDSAFLIDPTGEDPNLAALKCLKLRISPQRDYALGKKANGTWGFTESFGVGEAQARGIGLDILRILREYGPQSLSELAIHPAIGGTRDGIRQALLRAKRRGWVRPYRSLWEPVTGVGDVLLKGTDPEPDPDVLCGVCYLPMVPVPGATAHPECQDTPPDTQAPITAPAQASMPAQRDTEEDTWDPDPEPEDAPGFRGLSRLKESVDRSRMHPLRCVPLDKRDEGPWPLITERMGGEPRVRMWERTELPIGGRLLLVDRNGSYPSACSSVRLAPNRLLHTGAQAGYDSSLAGLYEVRTPVWKDPNMPHPLGAIVQFPSDTVWISTPHMALLTKLAAEGAILPPVIVDSWLGRANGSLFEHFYKDARAERLVLAPRGPQDPVYKAYKKSVSTALRLLWPKNRENPDGTPKAPNSPFWRPDWRVSMVAEASVRHWVTARAAQQAGALLVKLRNVDAAEFWVADGEPATVPGYKIGEHFGEVTIEEIS